MQNAISINNQKSYIFILYQPRMIILDIITLWILRNFKKEVFLSDYFNPKLNSFLIQTKAMMYMYSIRPSIQTDDQNYF